MERPIIESKIAESLKKLSRGNVLFVDDFLDFGNSESIKKALFRLKTKLKTEFEYSKSIIYN